MGNLFLSESTYFILREKIWKFFQNSADVRKNHANFQDHVISPKLENNAIVRAHNSKDRINEVWKS